MTAAPRRIDVHFHLIPPFYRDAVYEAGRGPAIGKYPDWTPQIALDVMDANGIEVALTSLAQPGVGFGTPASAQTLARRANDYAAELVARWPSRFGAFATVPMGSMDGARAGGLVPYFAWRLAVSPMIDARLPQLSRDQVAAGLAHFWYDNALSPGEQTFGALDRVARPERIVFGSDFPFANPRVIVEAVKTHESGFLPEARRTAIDRGNALVLFPKFAA